MSHTEQTEAYVPLPLGTATAGADTYVQMDKIGTENTHENLDVLFGKFVDGKFVAEHIAFWRFEVDMAEFRKISQAVFELQGYLFGGRTKMKGGFLIPQSSGTNDWQDSNGVAEWVDDNDMPLPMWNNGANIDNTVFQNGNFGFAIPLFAGSSFSTVTIGEGADLLTGAINDTSALVGEGFVAQLQDYLDANESLRGHTVSGSIPVLFCMFLDGAAVAAITTQGARAQNNGANTFLRLIHDWERISFDADLPSSTLVECELVVRAPMSAEIPSATQLTVEMATFDPEAEFIDLAVNLDTVDVVVPNNILGVAVEANSLDVAAPENTLDVTVVENTLDVTEPLDTVDIPVRRK